MSNCKKLRVALVGCGAVSANHIAAIKESGIGELVALCDVIEEKAKARIAEYELSATCFTDYEKMLEEIRPDVVHIATPHYLHVPMAISALNRDINVFLEKPLGISREQIKDLLEAERESRGKISVCFQNRFNSTTAIAKRIADEDGGAIGAFGSLFWQRTKEYYTESGWRGKYATEGGGVMINQAIHTIDLLCFFLGIPQKVSATTANHHLKGIIEVEDSCGGRIVFEGGKIANFYATNACVGIDATNVLIKTKHHKIEILTPGRIYLDGKEIDVEKHTSYVGKECYGVGHFKIIADFYRSIIDKTEVPVSVESAKWALRILLAAYESGGEEIDV